MLNPMIMWQNYKTKEKYMKYKFVCSGKEVDISSPMVFSKLCGDELSELLCEDPSYITWISEKNIARMEAFDVVTVLRVRPELTGHFIHKLKEEKFMSDYEWNYLLKENPNFKQYRQNV